MNATNRTLNRVVLLIAGLMAAIGGTALLLLTTRPPWAAEWVDRVLVRVQTAVQQAQAWTVALPGGGEIRPAGPLLAIAAVVLLIGLIAFLVTRGGGRTATVVREGSDRGETSVDANVAEAVLAGVLRERPDVLSARTSTYLVRRTPSIKLTVTLRRGAKLPRIIRAAEKAVGEWDALVGGAIPVVLHLSDRGWADRWRSATRVR